MLRPNLGTGDMWFRHNEGRNAGPSFTGGSFFGLKERQELGLHQNPPQIRQGAALRLPSQDPTGCNLFALHVSGAAV